MAELPKEAEKLLAAAPDEFVSERDTMARAFRDAGRSDDARAIAALTKPPAVVLAVNRAARDRSQAASDAAYAAGRLRSAQLSGDAEAFADASAALERALGLLSEVAVAQLSRSKPASEASRRRVSELLRAAVAEEATREALLRGALLEEREASGFTAFAGSTLSRGRTRGKSSREASRADREAERRERERALKAELAAARDSLRDAERTLRDAARERDRAAKAFASLESKLDRL